MKSHSFARSPSPCSLCLFCSSSFGLEFFRTLWSLSFDLDFFYLTLSTAFLYSFASLQSVLRASTGTAAASLVHSVCTALGRVTISQASVSACPASLARCVTKASIPLCPSDLCQAFSLVFCCVFSIYSGLFDLKCIIAPWYSHFVLLL